MGFEYLVLLKWWLDIIFAHPFNNYCYLFLTIIIICFCFLYNCTFILFPVKLFSMLYLALALVAYKNVLKFAGVNGDPTVESVESVPGRYLDFYNPNSKY